VEIECEVDLMVTQVVIGVVIGEKGDGLRGEDREDWEEDKRKDSKKRC
jgi:hypothetical protein